MVLVGAATSISEDLKEYDDEFLELRFSEKQGILLNAINTFDLR